MSISVEVNKQPTTEQLAKRKAIIMDMTKEARLARIAELKAEIAEIEEAIKKDDPAYFDMDELLKTCKEMVASGCRVEAIKLYRDRTGCYLKEATHAIDTLRNK